MDLSKSISELNIYINACNEDKYTKSSINMEGIIFDGMDGKGFNIGNATKYLSRYMTKGLDKSENPQDLLKSIHYILMEYKRVTNNNVKNENEMLPFNAT